MAQDQASQPKQDVDLDELEVEILIIGKNVTNLKQSGSFLTRRGWPTTVMTNVSQAIEYIAEKKPDYVLVSLNHPSSAAAKLPELITQTFNIECVVFAESLDSASTAKLNQARVRHKIQGQPSGPNLQRAMRKILAEKLNLRSDSGSESESTADSSGSLVTIKGVHASAHQAGGTIVAKGDGATVSQGVAYAGGAESVKQSSSGASKAPAAANPAPASAKSGISPLPAENPKNPKNPENLENPADPRNSENPGSREHSRNPEIARKTGNPAAARPEDSQHEEEGSTSPSIGPFEREVLATGKYTMSKRTRKSLKDLSREHGGVESKSTSSGVSSSELVGRIKQSLFGASGVDAETEGASPEDLAQTSESSSGPVSKESSAQKGPQVLPVSPASASSTSPPSPPATATVPPAPFAPPQTSPAASAQETARPAPKKPGFPLQKTHNTGTLNSTDVSTDPKSEPTLMEKAVEAALAEVCQSAGSPTALKKVARIGVFPVSSSVSHGYLVIAWEGAQGEGKQTFLKNCEQALQTAFKSMGVPGTLESGFWLPVPTVEFYSWIRQEGEFTLSLSHNSAEVGVGFLSTHEPLPRALPQANKEMYSIGISKISTEQPVNFKAYLHLRQNDKYFLYLRNGRQLQPEQKERLQSKNFKDFSLKSVDVENLRMYFALIHIHDSIRGRSKKKTAA
ncbi:MAG: hypothetical protein AB7G93_02110 [Bdellovibrionales bacterium]